MKKLLALIMSMAILLSLTGCSVKKPAGLTVTDAVTQIPESVKLNQTDEWPKNPYTDRLPVPSGKILWSMIDFEQNTCGIAIRGITKGSVDEYMNALENAGFSRIKKMEKPLARKGYVSLGTLFSDGTRTLSLSYADPVLMITVSMSGISPAGKSFLRSAPVTNIYQYSHATYNETDGIGIVTELYVSDRDKIQPQFTGFHGVAVISLGEKVEHRYFGGTLEQARSIGTLLKTGILGQSGEKGTVTVSGIAYSENAVGECGSFVITYGITIP